MKKFYFTILTIIPLLFGCNKDDDSNKEDACCFAIFFSSACHASEGGDFICVYEDELLRIISIIEESQEDCVFISNIVTTDDIAEGYFNGIPVCFEFEFDWDWN